MVKNLTKKQLILIIATVLIIISIPLGIYLVKRQQTIQSRANQTIECPSDGSNKLTGESCIEGFMVKEFIYKTDNQCKVFLELTANKCVKIHPTLSPTPKATLTPSPSASLPASTSKPQNTPTPDPADFNKDTKVNSYDYSILIGRFGDRGVLIEDLNKDGVVNSVDAALFFIAQKK